MQTPPTRVAILASSDKTQQLLSDLLESAGLEIVARELPSDDFLSTLENSTAEVLLVDMSEETDSEIDIIDTLLDYNKLPILFNDSSPASGGANAVWAKKLVRKLSALVSSHITKTPVASDISGMYTLDLDDITAVEEISTTSEPITDTPSSLSLEEPSDETTLVQSAETTIETDIPFTEEVVSVTEATVSVNEEKSAANKPEGAAINFWVLGASLGGPQAVRQFLSAVKEDLPVAFILAQHIGGNHISLLAEQLNRVTPFKVLTARSGYLLRHHEVVLAPAEHSISITEDGYLSLNPAPENAIYSPSVDDAMTAVADRYGKMAGTIIFSGMGDDGARGCEAIAKNGGVVWAQDVDSCVISSMPDQARKTNTVTYSADPRMLADQLYRYYCDA